MSYWCNNGCGNMPGKPMEGMDNSKFCLNCQNEIDEVKLSMKKEDFEKAVEALRKANIPPPWKAIYNVDK